MNEKSVVDITGINKAKLLAGLYNQSHPMGMGFLHYDPKPMTEEEAAEILAAWTHFDYLKGRVMKIDLSSDTEVDARLYDRDHFTGAVQKVVDILRATGDSNSAEISKVHKLGTAVFAMDALEMSQTKSTMEKKDGIATFTLGADDLGPSLESAALKAIDGLAGEKK
jgi:hypothetical protein